MKRYEPTTNCENAVMVEDENGDYVSVYDAGHVWTALEDMIIEFGWFARGYDENHPIQVALQNARDVMVEYQFIPPKPNNLP